MITLRSPTAYTACDEGSVSLIYVSLSQHTVLLLLLYEHRPSCCAVISQE